MRDFETREHPAATRHTVDAEGETAPASRRAAANPRGDLTLLKQWAEQVLGTRSSPSLIADVREVLIGEALARTDGNISRAARLLGVTRQAVQQSHDRGKAPVRGER